MRYDAPIVVKRYAPIIGAPRSPRRVTVARREYRVGDAVARARQELEFAARHYGPEWRCAVWVERRGAPATIARGRGRAAR